MGDAGGCHAGWFWNSNRPDCTVPLSLLCGVEIISEYFRFRAGVWSNCAGGCVDKCRYHFTLFVQNGIMPLFNLTGFSLHFKTLACQLVIDDD